MRRHLELCLDCRACETACPSGVHYGRLIEPFRLAVEQADDRGREAITTGSARSSSSGCFPTPTGCGRLLTPVRLLQRLGLFDLAERLGLFKLMPGRLGRMMPLLPPPVKPGPKLPKFLPAIGPQAGPGGVLRRLRGRRHVPPTHWATLRVLQQNGCDVFIPPGQGCCGAIHFHAGDSRGARRMADANLVAFELDRYDAIVVNHGGCGAMMKEYGLHWHDGLQPHREKFAAKVKDVNEFLDELGLIPPHGPDRGRGHLSRRLPPGPRPGHHGRPAAAAWPRFPGLELRDLPETGICCGSAGTYNLNEADMADRLGRAQDREHPRAPAPRSCWPPTPAACCKSGREVRQRQLPLAVMHPMDLLDLSYRGKRVL